MDFAKFDLHLHTLWSYDATAPVECYFQLARDRGVKYIAVTEHFHRDSLPELLAVAPSYPDVRCLLGAELTGDVEGFGMDIVCLGLPLDLPAGTRAVIDANRRWAVDYADAFASGLREAGIPYSDAERLALLRSYRPLRCIESQGLTIPQCRLERQYLLDRYFHGSVEEYNALVWDKELNFFHRLPRYAPIREISDAVHAAGGLVFIAHPAEPFRKTDERRMDELRELINFDGIECAHTHVHKELTPVYRAYCRKHGLLSSAGTDCHSVEGAKFRFGADAALGVHIGESAWMDEILERLKPEHFVR